MVLIKRIIIKNDLNTNENQKNNIKLSKKRLELEQILIMKAKKLPKKKCDYHKA